MAKSSRQLLQGKVSVAKEGRTLEGLTVEVVDKNLRRNEKIKAATTDKQGRFKIVYELDDKDASGAEGFLQILDKQGTVIAVQAESVFRKSGALDQLEIKIPDAALDASAFDYARFQFKSLVAINPNYFGAYDKMEIEEFGAAIFPKQGDTRYEELECIGLYPETDELEAIFKVKLPYGFGGDLCSDGSKEYVAFYIDYGSGFQPTGPAVTVNTHNIGAARRRPLCYAVKQVVDFKKQSCKKPFLVKVRAILSWNTPPTGPNYIPTWGNSVDAWVQIDPLKKSWELITSDYAELSLLKSYSDLQVSQKEIIASIQGSLDYNKQDLEEDRIDFKKNILENPNYYGGLADKENIKEAINAVQGLPPEIFEKYKPKLINPEWLYPVKPIIYNTGNRCASP